MPDLPPYDPYESFLERMLDEGADGPVIFPPAHGWEFGHVIMTRVRQAFFHNSPRKIVAIPAGHQVLYPDAAEFIVDDSDDIPDWMRIGTFRHPVEWTVTDPDLEGIRVLPSGNLTMHEELAYPILPEIEIPLSPILRGLDVDVVLGCRRREYDMTQNWPYWEKVAEGLEKRGVSFAQVGVKSSSVPLTGAKHRSWDYPDMDAAVEMLQKCRAYCGTDSGVSHLASLCQARRMFVFRQRNRGRNFFPRMQFTNHNPVETSDECWGDPEFVLARVLGMLD